MLAVCRRCRVKILKASKTFDTRKCMAKPLVNTCEKHLLTDHLSAEQPHPIVHIGEPSVVTISDSGRTFFFT